jgi:carotenoid phi-ring synthase / carotenoid chi-ring synthase
MTSSGATAFAATKNAPPFAVWRLWLDRPVRAARPPFDGTSGFGPLDNVSVLERFEAGARDWSELHGGSVVGLQAYGLAAETNLAELQQALRDELGRVYPKLSMQRSSLISGWSKTTVP